MTHEEEKQIAIKIGKIGGFIVVCVLVYLTVFRKHDAGIDTSNATPVRVQEPSTSSSNSSSSYGETKTCSWCGKSFTGNGYNYVLGECIQRDGDYYTKCSMRCCSESRNSDPNLRHR